MRKKIIALILALSVVLEQTGFAQIAPVTPVPGYLCSIPPVADKFRPIQLRSVTFNPDSRKIDLILDKGDESDPGPINDIALRLYSYFKTGLVLPNSCFWVNLRPDAPDRIIDPELERTDIGRIMLSADVQLKKDIARFTDPSTKEGREYWNNLYRKAETLFGQEDIEIPAVTRPWIVPGEVIIGTSGKGAFIYKASLQVKLEQDWIKGVGSPASGSGGDGVIRDARVREINAYSTQLIKKLIIPKLTREVNSSKRYAPLRQVYYALILAQWVKIRELEAGSRERGVSIRELIDSGDLAGLTSKNKWSKLDYYKSYRDSFERGEYNTRDEISTPQGIIIRQYASGGMDFAAGRVVEIPSTAADFFTASGMFENVALDEALWPGQIKAAGEVSVEGMRAIMQKRAEEYLDFHESGLFRTVVEDLSAEELSDLYLRASGERRDLIDFYRQIDSGNFDEADVEWDKLSLRDLHVLTDSMRFLPESREGISTLSRSLMFNSFDNAGRASRNTIFSIMSKAVLLTLMGTAVVSGLSPDIEPARGSPDGQTAQGTYDGHQLLSASMKSLTQAYDGLIESPEEDALIPGSVNPVNTGNLDYVLKSMSGLPVRTVGSPENEAASLFIERVLEVHGFGPALDAGSVDAFNAKDPYAIHSYLNEIPLYVAAVIPGKDLSLPVEIVSMHFDGIFSGEDDNASGVAAGLEIARLLSALEPERTVYIVFTNAEETGFLGSDFFSRYLLSQGLQAGHVVEVDTIGQSHYTLGQMANPEVWALPLGNSSADNFLDTGTLSGFSLQKDPYSRYIPRDASIYHEYFQDKVVAISGLSYEEAGLESSPSTEHTWASLMHTPADKGLVNRSLLADTTFWLADIVARQSGLPGGIIDTPHSEPLERSVEPIKVEKDEGESILTREMARRNIEFNITSNFTATSDETEMFLEWWDYLSARFPKTQDYINRIDYGFRDRYNPGFASFKGDRINIQVEFGNFPAAWNRVSNPRGGGLFFDQRVMWTHELFHSMIDTDWWRDVVMADHLYDDPYGSFLTSHEVYLTDGALYVLTGDVMHEGLYSENDFELVGDDLVSTIAHIDLSETYQQRLEYWQTYLRAAGINEKIQPLNIADYNSIDLYGSNDADKGSARDSAQRDGGYFEQNGKIAAEMPMIDETAKIAISIARHIKNGEYDAIVMSGDSSILPYRLVHAAWKRISPDPLKIYALDGNENARLYRSGNLSDRVRTLDSLITKISADIGRKPENILYIDTHWLTGSKRDYIEHVNWNSSLKVKINYAVFASPKSVADDFIGKIDQRYCEYIASLADSISGRAWRSKHSDLNDPQALAEKESLLDKDDLDRLRAVEDAINRASSLGGVDFSIINMAERPGVSVSADSFDLDRIAARSGITDLDSAWNRIEKDIQGKEIPYVRIKEYVAVCKSRPGADKNLAVAAVCLFNILKIEEDNALPTDPRLKELLFYVG